MHIRYIYIYYCYYINVFCATMVYDYLFQCNPATILHYFWSVTTKYS